MKKLVLVGLLVLLILPVIAQSQVVDSATLLRDLNERLERNKAELLKEIKDSTQQNEVVINQSIDSNFAVLDTRMNDFFKNSERTIAVIMVVGFMVGFTLSQIVKIKIEQMKRKALVKRAYELETKVNGLQHEATKLTQIVHELKIMDSKYSQQLKNMKPKRFLSGGIVVLMVITFLVGVGVTYFLVVVS
jgi:hypothetical protein